MTKLPLPEPITLYQFLSLSLTVLCILVPVVLAWYVLKIRQTDSHARTMSKRQAHQSKLQDDFQLVLDGHVITRAEYDHILALLPPDDADLLTRVLPALQADHQVADVERHMLTIILRESLHYLRTSCLTNIAAANTDASPEAGLPIVEDQQAAA